MASEDYSRLAQQGRAKSATEPWQPEELDAVLLLERERKIPRTDAATYVRNGVMTLEAYDAATVQGFVPKTPQEIMAEHAQEVRQALQEGESQDEDVVSPDVSEDSPDAPGDSPRPRGRPRKQQ